MTLMYNIKALSLCVCVWYDLVICEDLFSSFSLCWIRDLLAGSLTAQTNPVILQTWLSFLYTPKHKNGHMQLKTEMQKYV